MKISQEIIDQALEAVEEGMDGTGFCLHCGDEACEVEPDARNYRCESCGFKAVFGAEEILIMAFG